ncbi:MAG: site-specific DNA-methyltransferase [Thiocapsa sp. C3-sup]
MAPKPAPPITVETLTHDEATRKNIPTAEYQSVMRKDEQDPVRVTYARGPVEQPDALADEKAQRNRDLDPQLIWRGKDQQDWSDLVVHAPPLYIQEKVHPKALIDDLRRQLVGSDAGERQLDLFSDFNGIPKDADKTEFYRHDQNWSNRMILGDSLQVMASLAEREGLRGKVQCIYIDPPYGIKFNSNFQWSTTSRDVKDGNVAHITREPEQVKAFRDTWRDGIHSYLTYFRDRLTVARDLLSESGSIFVQIGDENVHRVRAVMDEVFGDANFLSLITIKKTTGAGSPAIGTKVIPATTDFIVWYAKTAESVKYRQAYVQKKEEDTKGYDYVKDASGLVIAKTKDAVGSLCSLDNLTSQTGADSTRQSVDVCGRSFQPRSGGWKTNETGMLKLKRAARLGIKGNTLRYVRVFADFPVRPQVNLWDDISQGGFVSSAKVYVVQTNEVVVQRCILMTTDPGDLVLDPTCGGGTIAYVAEQWGRRWITIDTSRVALALARARIMGARYPYYLLADSPAGQLKEAEITRSAPSSQPTRGDIRHGFVYERVPHITLKSIANNAEIDVIWDKWQETLEPLRERLNALLVGWAERSEAHHSGTARNDGLRSRSAHPTSGPAPFEEWQMPRDAEPNWPQEARDVHADWWVARIARQREIDASIAAKADSEYLYDKPYTDKKTVRVSGPFTVESLSPHRVLGVDENDELIDPANSVANPDAGYGDKPTFSQMILDNLKVAGVQQAHKDDKITFTSLTPWPGDLICAEGRFSVDSREGRVERQRSLATDHSQLSTHHSPLTTENRAAIFIGPEFGTVTRPDLVSAAREAGDADFDVLIACAFNYEAHATEFNKLGRIPVLKARMNADLHMAEDLKTTNTGNLFVIFGEPDIIVASEEWLVDSNGKRVAPYDIYQFISGLDRLEEINGLGRDDLCRNAAIARRREIWDFLADASRGLVGGGEHRRGSGAKDDGGVSPVAWYGARLAGGARDLYRTLREAGVHRSGEFRSLIERLRRDQQNARSVDALACHAPLTTRHYSQVTIFGVDVFHPGTGEVRSDGPEGIACWFIDTDYNEESFFVRHAYFLGAEDPYKALKTTLKAEIDEDAWASLNSDTSRPFPKPASGRIAVKVINHLGDEVMKVFRVGS